MGVFQQNRDGIADTFMPTDYFPGDTGRDLARGCRGLTASDLTGR